MNLVKESPQSLWNYIISVYKVLQVIWTVVPKEYYIDGLVSLIYVTKMIYRGFLKNDLQNIYKCLRHPIKESAADLTLSPNP